MALLIGKVVGDQLGTESEQGDHFGLLARPGRTNRDSFSVSELSSIPPALTGLAA